MSSQSKPEVEEGILEALVSGNRARAMLFHLRHYGGTPQEAWRTINEIVEIPNYEEPAQDPHVDRVERYLNGRHTASSIRWNAMLTFIVVFGALFVVRGSDRMITGIESYWWPPTTAVVNKVRYYGDSYYAQQRKVVRRYVDYNYTYKVRGQAYSQTIVRQSYVETFDGPRMNPGDIIDIVFDNDAPARSVHMRDMYQRALPVMFGTIVMLPALGLLALSAYFELTYRDLEKCDPLRTTNSQHAASKATAASPACIS